MLVALAATWRYTGLHDIVTPAHVVAWAWRMRQMPGAAVLLVLSYTVAAAIMFPRALLTLATVIAFGPLLGTAYCALGVMVAAMVYYAVGRYGSKDWVAKLAGDKTEALGELMRTHGVAAIFALNMVPAPPFVVQSIMAGALRVPTLHYMLGSFLGMLPTVLGWAFFGRQIAASLEEGEGVSLWAVALVVVAMVAITIAVRRWFARHSGGG